MVEPVLPSAANIAGAHALDYSMVHIKSIRLTGGTILGHRPLQDDGGWEGLVGEPDRGPGVHEGSWGYLHLEDLAHEHFGRHFPEHPTPAVERPTPLQSDSRDS